MQFGCSCCTSHTSRRSFLGGLAAAGIFAKPANVFAAAGPALALEAWLEKRPHIANAITWLSSGQPKAASYSQWSGSNRQSLQAAFANAWSGRPSGLVDPPPNSANTTDPTSQVTHLALNDAWPLYLATVGHCLAVEIGRRVGWSIEKDSDEQLAALLSGPAMFTLNQKTGLYMLMLKSVPPPPETAFSFLTSQSLIAPQRLGTIERTLQWCSQRMVHFLGSINYVNMENSWQYRGYPPASRVISGTTYTGPNSHSGRQHLTAGCWGTTGFLVSVLRAINIPVEEKTILSSGGGKPTGRHSTPHFMSEDLFLSHGDDPYNALVRYRPSFELGKLLIRKEEFTAWFEGQPSRNVGRRPYDLAIVDPPIYILNEYATDLKAGKSKDGNTAQSFAEFFSVGDLDRLGFWDRLNGKIAGAGGPDAIQRQFKMSEQAVRQAQAL